jgi:hypothetical protein
VDKSDGARRRFITENCILFGPCCAISTVDPASTHGENREVGAIDLTLGEIAEAFKSGERARLGRGFRRLAETNLAPKYAKARRLRPRPRRTCSPERPCARFFAQ